MQVQFIYDEKVICASPYKDENPFVPRVGDRIRLYDEQVQYLVKAVVITYVFSNTQVAKPDVVFVRLVTTTNKWFE